MHLNHNKLTKQYQVTMNNDGIPLRELTLGGMLGQKSPDQSEWEGNNGRFRCMGWVACHARARRERDTAVQSEEDIHDALGTRFVQWRSVLLRLYLKRA